MIIGHGDLASALTDRPDVTWFASGVSNSKCTDVGEYEREVMLLINQPRDKHLVYFSSLCVYTSNTVYAAHKKVMEAHVRQLFTSYTIVRLGNIDWGTNPNTLINYLKAHPEAEIQNVYRHIVSLDEFKYWMNLIPVGARNEMNVPGRMVFVPDLVKALNRKIVL